MRYFAWKLEFVSCILSMIVECFPLTYDLNGFRSGINRHLLSVGSFYTDFLCANCTNFSCNSKFQSGCSALHGVNPNKKRQQQKSAWAQIFTHFKRNIKFTLFLEYCSWYHKFKCLTYLKMIIVAIFTN